MKMNGGNPSPKVFYFLIATVFVVVFSISHNVYRKNNPKIKNLNNNQTEDVYVSITNPTRNILSNLESDRFVNWEETLKKSLEEETIMGEEIFLSAGSETFTSSVSERAIMNLLQGLENPSGFNMENFAKEITDEASINITYRNKFDFNNLKIVDETDKSIRDYLNSFWLISVEEFSHIPEFQPTDFEAMMDFMPEIYDKIALRLSLVSVPKNLATLHLNYINSAAEMSHYAKILRQERTDPLLAYSAISKFQESSARADSLYTQIIIYPENNGIIFEEDDFAYIIYNEKN